MPKGPGASRAFAIATASCKKSGMKSFKKGSKGDSCRKKRAEGVARTRSHK